MLPPTAAEMPLQLGVYKAGMCLSHSRYYSSVNRTQRGPFPIVGESEMIQESEMTQSQIGVILTTKIKISKFLNKNYEFCTKTYRKLITDNLYILFNYIIILL